MAITVIGDALIDIVVPISGIKPGQTYHRNISISCGGTANVATQIAKLGENVTFVGRVGNDLLGSYFVDNLKKNWVNNLVFFDSDHPTGLCISMVNEDGERSMVASRGANDYWTREGVSAYLDQIVKSKFAYFSGYTLLYNSDTILYLMEKCRGNSKVWFNPGAPNLIRDSFRKVIRDFVDVLILNLDEARAITKKSQTSEIVADLAKLAGLSVITLGNAGCIVSTGKEWLQVPVDNLIEDADTTGVGDAFSAGFMVGKLRGMDELQCARSGHEVAANFLEEKGRIV